MLDMLNYKNLCIFVLSCALVACQTTVQNTSGEDYLAKYNLDKKSLGTKEEASFKKLLIEATQVNPTLSFPARIGLAKISSLSSGRAKIENVTPEEATVWLDIAKGASNRYGEFILVDPLIAELTVKSLQSNSSIDIHNAIHKVRLAAARQHLDAVLIYGFNHNSKENGFWLLNLATLGSLPTTNVSSRTQISALLIDVIQGYPYGNVTEFVDSSTLSRPTRVRKNTNDLNEENISSALRKVSPKIKEMFEKVYKNSLSRK
jgi:hypothetical protein